jgi:hypothetical protein
MKNLLLLLIISLTFSVFAEEKIIYKYKTYEKFDLGGLKVKGKIIAPTDLTVKTRQTKVFKENLYEKRNFNKENFEDIQSLF